MTDQDNHEVLLTITCPVCETTFPLRSDHFTVDKSSEAIIIYKHCTSCGYEIVETLKQFKCQTCGKFKSLDEFYRSRSGRASPHCIACNPNAVRLARYKHQIRTQGREAFIASMTQKEQQLATMTQALSEVQV